MSHHAAAILTVRALRVRDALADARGQGTVEYVGLILLIAAVLAAIVAWQGSQEHGLGAKVVKEIGDAIDKAGSGGK